MLLFASFLISWFMQQMDIHYYQPSFSVPVAGTTNSWRNLPITNDSALVAVGCTPKHPNVRACEEKRCPVCVRCPSSTVIGYCSSFAWRRRRRRGRQDSTQDETPQAVLRALACVFVLFVPLRRKRQRRADRRHRRPIALPCGLAVCTAGTFGDCTCSIVPVLYELETNKRRQESQYEKKRTS